MKRPVAKSLSRNLLIRSVAIVRETRNGVRPISGFANNGDAPVVPLRRLTTGSNQTYIFWRMDTSLYIIERFYALGTSKLIGSLAGRR